MRPNDLHRNFTSPSHQRGVVLVITLIVLIAMTLATIALVRSVDTSNVVAGNLAFKQAATQAGDRGTEAAVAWLETVAGTAASYEDIPASGYYAASLDMDMVGNGTDPNRYLVDWEGDNCGGAVVTLHCKSPLPNPITVVTGYEVKYIIHRLCQSPGSINAPGIQNCATTASFIPGTPSSIGDDYKTPLDPTTLVEYYRITTRIKGPHNSLSHIETLVH